MLNRRTNEEKYMQDVLKTAVLPKLRQLTQEHQKYYYIHDRALCHRLKLVKN